MDLLQFAEGEVCSDIIKQTQIFIVEQLFEGIPTNGVFSIALLYCLPLSFLYIRVANNFLHKIQRILS